MTKKLSVLILFFITALMLAACTAPETPSPEDFQYIINGDSVTIVKYTGGQKAAVIPEKIEGKTVTSVADGAFSGSDVLAVTVASTVSNITELAFKDCSNLRHVIFEGDAPLGFDQAPGNNSREGNYRVYFKADAKGAPAFDSTGYGEWNGYTARLRDDSRFSLPFCYVSPSGEPLTADEIKELAAKIPGDRYEQYPGQRAAPLSATLYIDGAATPIDTDDVRLVKLVNLYHNTLYHLQHSLTQGSYDMASLAEFENDPNRLVLTYDSKADAEAGDRAYGVSVIINTSQFVSVSHDLPFGDIYPSTVFGHWPYYLTNHYNWLELFEFFE